MMKFYKSFNIPCSVSIPQVQQVAMSHGVTLLACNSADITDLCQDELDYIGPESQTLLFWLHASSEGLAEQQLEKIKVALLQQSYVIGTAASQNSRQHAKITVASDQAMNNVTALLDSLNDALTDLEDGFSIAHIARKKYAVSASTYSELAHFKCELAKIDGVKVEY